MGIGLFIFLNKKVTRNSESYAFQELMKRDETHEAPNKKPYDKVKWEIKMEHFKIGTNLSVFLRTSSLSLLNQMIIDVSSALPEIKLQIAIGYLDQDNLVKYVLEQYK